MKNSIIIEISSMLSKYELDEYYDTDIICETCNRVKFFSLHYGLECDCD